MKLNDKIVELSIDEITLCEGSHNIDSVVGMIKESLLEFGVQQPIVVDRNKNIVAGNAIYRAAKDLGFTSIPCVIVDNLTEDEIAQYRIADNKTSEFAKWNEQKLKKELSYMQDSSRIQFCFDENLSAMFVGCPTADVKVKKDNDEQNHELKQKKDAAFRETLNNIEHTMEAKTKQYIEYTCSDCGKKVTIKL